MSVPWNVIGFLWRICGSSARDFPHRGSEVRLVTGPLQHEHVAGIKYRVAYKYADGGMWFHCRVVTRRTCTYVLVVAASI